MNRATQNIAPSLASARDGLTREIRDLDAFNRAAGLNFNVGWGARGGLFDKKLDRLRGRLLLLDAELSVMESE